MNNLSIFGIMPKDYESYTECTDSMINFSIILTIILILSTIILILEIMCKKQFKTLTIILIILIIPLSIAGIILSLNLS